MLDAVLVQLGADDTKLTGGVSGAGTQIHLAGDKVKVDPGAILGRQDSLCAQNHTVGSQVQFFQSIPHKVHSELLMGLGTPGAEDLVRMMVMMVVFMIMAAAGALLIVLMMVVLMVMFVIMVLMLVIVLMAIAMFIVMVMLMFVIMVVTIQKIQTLGGVYDMIGFC